MHDLDRSAPVPVRGNLRYTDHSCVRAYWILRSPFADPSMSIPLPCVPTHATDAVHVCMHGAWYTP